MYWFNLWKLKRARQKTVKSFKASLEKTKDWAERQELDRYQNSELSEYEDAIATLKTKRLLKKARSRDLVIPQGEDFWERSTWTGDKFLTTAGRAKLRDDIRNDGKQRRDVIRDVLIVVSVTISVLSFVNSCRKK